MPFVASLRLDDATAARVDRLARRLAPDVLPPPYRPHVTLAVWPDDADPAALIAAIDQLADRFAALPCLLSAVGFFPGPPAVLWLAPAVTAALLDCHAWLAACQPAGHSHYAVGQWMPHVTMAIGVDNAAAAVGRILEGWEPLAGRLDRAQLLQVPPATVLRLAPLRQPGRLRAM